MHPFLAKLMSPFRRSRSNISVLNSGISTPRALRVSTWERPSPALGLFLHSRLARGFWPSSLPPAHPETTTQLADRDAVGADRLQGESR